jgi:uncharacterized protein
MSTEHFLIDFLIGVVAGVVGGLTGLGGAIVMLPALGLYHGYETREQDRHHVFMAASMIVNIVVALSASVQHRRKGVVRIDLLKAMVPAMAAGMVIGVLLSSQSPGRWAVVAMACFIWSFCVFTLFTLVKQLPHRPEDARTPHWAILASIGLGTGIVGGYLGVGGGILLVPLLQIVGLPLRHAIAGSAGVMWSSATIGAGVKLWLLPSQGFERMDAIEVAVPMALGALIGAALGARLSHKLKLPLLKVVIVVVLSIAAARMVMKPKTTEPAPAPPPAAQLLGLVPQGGDLVVQPFEGGVDPVGEQFVVADRSPDLHDDRTAEQPGLASPRP